MKILRILMVALAALLVTGVSARISAQQTAPELYTCSMHPNVAESKPGQCPVCSMTLKTRAMTGPEKEVVAFFKAYDAAFVAKDMDKLANMYAPETTVYEGGGVNRGWKDYRDNHLGPEMKSYDSLEFAHSNVVPHVIGKDDAYVTADYAIKAKTGDRVMDGGGLATYTLTKESGSWKIRHTHTSAKRAAR
jgi:ketosteroid isomerase-like protein